MFCEKCGCQINDTAAFCPKCGNPIKKEDQLSGSPDAMNKDKTTSNIEEKGDSIKKNVYIDKPRSASVNKEKSKQIEENITVGKIKKKPMLVKSVVSGFLLFIIFFGIGYFFIGDIINESKENAEYERMQEIEKANDNLGAEKPEDIGIAYANALKTGDFSKLDHYIDRHYPYDEEKAAFTKIYEKDKYLYEKIDLNKVSCELVKTEQMEGAEAIFNGELNLYVKEKKLLVGDYANITIHIHQYKTTQGYRWFLGE